QALALSMDGGPSEPEGEGAPAVLEEAAQVFAAPREQRAAAQPLRAQIEAELARVRARHSLELSGGLELRHRDGESGLSALDELRYPAEGTLPLGYRGKLGVRVVPVLLGAGTLDLGNAGLADRTGSAGPL